MDFLANSAPLKQSGSGGCQWHPWLILAVFPLLGMLCLYWALHRHGISLSFDSSMYLLTAENFLQGEGVDILLSSGRVLPQMHYPPFYSVLLAVVMWMGADNFSAPLYLNIVLFGANIFLLSLIVYRQTCSLPLAFLASFLLFSSNVLVYIHTIAMSEALFIFLGFSGFHFVMSYLKTQKYFFLIASALCMGLALWTRHSGFAFVAAGAAVIIVVGKDRVGRAVRDASVFFFIALAPMTFWMAFHFNSLKTYVELGGRSISLHLFGLGKLLALGNTISQWILPGKVPFSLRIPILCAMVVSIFYLILKFRKRIVEILLDSLGNVEYALLTVLFGFLLFYAFLLLFSILLVDAFISLDARILSPAYVASLLIAIFLLNKIPSVTLVRPKVRWVIFAVIACCSILSMARSVNYLAILHADGGGYARECLRKSQILEFLRMQSPDVVIYANDPAPIYLFTGRRADFFPNATSPFTNIPNKDFDKQLRTLESEMANRSAIVVCFKDGVHKFMTGYCVGEAELLCEIPMRVVLMSADGKVYRRAISAKH